MNNSLYIDWILVVHFGLHFVVKNKYLLQKDTKLSQAFTGLEAP